MKKAFIVVWMMGLFFVSCDEQTLPGSFNLGLEENFHIGSDYLSADNLVKFRITEINDSRCPSDVVCIWQGEARVKISMDSPQKGEIELSTFDNPVDTIGVYSFELIDVSPYPVSTKKIKLEDYDVKLKILKLED